MRILNTIDKIRHKLLKDIDNFYLKFTIKKDFCEKVKKDMDASFDLKRLHDTIKSVFNKEVRHEVFQERMKQVLSDKDVIRERQILLSYFEKAEKGKDMVFDKMSFLKKENWIIEQIHQQEVYLKEAKVTIEDSSTGI